MQTMLAVQVDYVIGVDTHRDTNTAAIVEAATGGVVDDLQCPTDAMGYKRTYAFATKHAPGRRVWAIEGTGSYGRPDPPPPRQGHARRRGGPPQPPGAAPGGQPRSRSGRDHGRVFTS